MKKYIVIFLISIFLLIIDNTLMPMMSIGGAYPSLLFVFCISLAFYSDRKFVIYIACLGGLLQDIFFMDVLGINALINLILCVIVSLIGKNFIKSKIIVPVFMVLCASILKGLILIPILNSFGHFLYIKRILIVSAYNFVIAAILEKIIFKFYNLEGIKKDWEF